MNRMTAKSTVEEPWYQAGLQFRCTQCGDCCTGAPGFVWVNDEEIQAIADFLHEPLDQVIAVHTHVAFQKRSLREKAGGDCVFYDKIVGCTIYAARPGQCRTWPFWDSNIKTPNTWQRTCEICPGAGEGELIPVEEITRRLNVIRL
jgi:uncharacterized protein